MIAAVVLFLIVPALLVWLGIALAREISGYRKSKQPAETWAETRARLAHENRCDELGRRFFGSWNPTLFDGDNKQ